MRISDWSSDVCSSDLGSQVEPPDAVLVDMVADAKGVAADVDEAIAAIKGLRAGVFGEHRQIEDRRPLARPGNAPSAQRRGDPGALCRRVDIEQNGRASCRETGSESV